MNCRDSWILGMTFDDVLQGGGADAGHFRCKRQIQPNHKKMNPCGTLRVIHRDSID